MKRLRIMMAAALVATFAITTMGPFTVAETSQTRMIVINGWPNKKVDVCLNGKAKRSGLKYGGRIALQAGNAKKVLKFFSDNGPICGGTLLGKLTFDPPAGRWDLTLVLTPKPFNKAKRVLLWVANDFYEDVDPGDGVIILSNAASVGKLDMHLDLAQGPITVPRPSPAGPAASPSGSPWAKGDQAGGTVPVDEEFKSYSVVVTKHGKTKTLAKTPFRGVREGKRDESIVLGTNLKNIKLLRFYGPAVKATPPPGP
jgi:hypothetical protein